MADFREMGHGRTRMRGNSRVRWRLSPGARAGFSKPLKVHCMNPLNPKKLLLTKWTALKPTHKDKHFLVAKVVLPEPPDTKIEWIEVEAVFSKQRQTLAWRALQDDTVWAQGWV